MEIFEALRGRRSIRDFLDKDVPAELIKKLIDAARWAPSAGNLQSWEFIIVKDNVLKRKLASAAGGQFFIARAPVVVVVCANMQRSSWRYGMRGATLYSIQDAAAATQNLLLAAHALDLGACWVGAFNEEAAKVILEIPEGVRPVAIIPVGYPAEHPYPPSRRRLNDIIHIERF